METNAVIKATIIEVIVEAIFTSNELNEQISIWLNLRLYIVNQTYYSKIWLINSLPFFSGVAFLSEKYFSKKIKYVL